MVSYNVGWKHGWCLSLFMQTRAKEFVKVFLFHFRFIDWIAWGQAKVYAWGSWYVSNVSTFCHDFPLVLDSNLHDLNKTNPGLTLFSAELPWCCFCVEIKVLGMERNFARNFYIINKNFWSQDLLGRGTWVGTTHQGTPPSPGALRWFVPTWWPRIPWNQRYKILFFQKK